MADKLPFQITPGTPNDDSVVHASDADESDLSRSHNERGISRLQGTSPLYSASKTYALNDLVEQFRLVFRCTTAVTVAESFDFGKWEIAGNRIPPFNALQDYPGGSTINVGGISYRNPANVTAGAFDPSEWTPIGNSAPAYSSLLTYGLNEFTTESDLTYQCITAITIPEAFNSTKWKQFVENPLANDLDADGNNLLNVNNITVEGRILGNKGADVASATTITLVDGNFFDVTGTTQIDAMTSTGWTPGSVVSLHFDAALTVTHNTGADGFFLAGATNFTSTIDDTLTVVWNGSRWEELSRSIN